MSGLRRRLSRGRSARGDASTSDTSATQSRRRRSRSPMRSVQKTGRSIKGLITGSSKKKSKTDPPISAIMSRTAPGTPASAEQSPPSSINAPPAIVEEDDETVYGVQVDEMSVVGGKREAPTTAASAGKSSKEGRVNEAPQDATTPLIPSPSAAPTTDTSARADAAFSSGSIQVILLLMDAETRRFELLQLEFDSDKALVADVLAQVPLSATEESLRTQQYLGVCDKKGFEMVNSFRLAEFCKGQNEVVLAIPPGMTAQECSKLARPILTDPKVISMLDQNAGEAPESPPPPARQAKPREALTETKGGRNKKPADKALPFNGAGAKKEDKTKKIAKKSSKNTSSVFNFVFTLVFLVGIAHLGKKVHDHFTLPLEPGHTLAPGMWKSKCGLLSFIPEEHSGCHPSTVKMDRDGTLSYYDGKDLMWQMKGEACAEGDNKCVDGLVVNEDGSIAIGGKPVSGVVGNIQSSLSPWPFKVDPAKVKKTRGYW